MLVARSRAATAPVSGFGRAGGGAAAGARSGAARLAGCARVPPRCCCALSHHRGWRASSWRCSVSRRSPSSSSRCGPCLPRSPTASCTCSPCCSSRPCGELWLGAAHVRSLSAAAFNFFHIPPTGRFTISDGRTGSRSASSSSPRVVASSVADARPGARERRPSCAAARPTSRPSWRGCCSADDQRRGRCRPAAAAAGRRARPAVGGDRARRGGARRAPRAFPLRRGHAALGTLLVPERPARRRRARGCSERVVPALEALLAAALERDRLQAEVVETRRCAAATSSRRRCCAPSRTTCARR